MGKRIKVKGSIMSRPVVVVEEEVEISIDDMDIERLRGELKYEKELNRIINDEVLMLTDTVLEFSADRKRLTEYNLSLKSLINKYIKDEKQNKYE